MASVTSWNRLEPRARSGDMRPGLEARIHDPLWLLARQRQVGEFQGEDAGAPVSVRLRMQVARVGRMRAGGAAIDLGATTPVDVPVAGTGSPAPDVRWAVEAGLHFLRLLADAGAGEWVDPFRQEFTLPEPTADMDDPARRYLDLMRHRAPDGTALATALRGGLPVRPEVTTHRDEVRDAAARFLAWYDSVAPAPADPPAGGWQPDRFEYRFEVSTRIDGEDVVFRAADHPGGPIDWHSFVHAADTDLPGTNAVEPLVSTTLPVRAGYAGMPAARYWQLEDARVDFGGVEAAPTDLARMLVLDFATNYGNDWFVVPVELPLGSFTRISSCVVTDSFGARWSTGPASRGPERGLPRTAWWSMYEISAADGAQRLTGLLLPPAAAHTIDGEPVEEVLLLRDEGANIAWAIERTVTGAARDRIDRTEAWQRAQRWTADATRPGAPVQIAPLTYRLASDVPEHWIPLVPETDGGRTAYRISPFDRPIEGGVEPILPRGRLLDPDHVTAIPAEEVPAEGARVTRAWRYARWTDGSSHLWEARRKQAGRGAVSSGLGFDLLEPWRPPTAPLAYEPVAVTVSRSVIDSTPVDLDRMTGGGTALITWSIRNVGAQTWRRTGETPLLLATSNVREHPGRLRATSWLGPTRPTGIREPSVHPGAVGTFVFEITAPANGTFAEDFEPVVGADQWLDGEPLTLRGQVA